MRRGKTVLLAIFFALIPLKPFKAVRDWRLDTDLYFPTRNIRIRLQIVIFA